MQRAGLPGGEDGGVARDRDDRPVDRYPLLVASADGLTSCEDEDGYYRFGIDLFVAGVEGMLRRR
ncbi:MAG TPA: hypothetical protein VGL21_00155 [Jatrophihabitantaceae bacterium]